MRMPKIGLLLLLLAALLLGSGCGSGEETAPTIEQPAQDQETVQPEPASLQGMIAGDGGQLAYYQDGAPQVFEPGVREIDGSAYFVEPDGVTICGLQGLAAASDGNRYYFEADSSLRAFSAGFTALPEGMVYAEAAGYALAPFASEVAALEDALYAFDENGCVLSHEAGVQTVFGKQYLIAEAGYAMTRYEPGLLLQDGQLFYVQEDGALLTGEAVGCLTFGPDGRYTSGNETLDAQVTALLEACGAWDMTEPEEMLRAAYTYIRDNFKYLSMEHYAAGTVDWAEESALTFFDLGKGNCYCWAAATAYCARQLGYQAYVVAGWESNASNDHAWTMIDWPDGETYLFDAELEYAYWYMFKNKPKIDMFKASGDGSQYNGFTYFFP